MSRYRLRHVTHLTLAGVCLAALAACGGSDGSDGPDSPVAVPFADGWSVVGALGQVPEAAAGERVLVQTADLDAATKAAGLRRPAGGSREDLADWLLPLSGAAPADGEPAPLFVPIAESFNTAAASPDDFAGVVGWSINDVTAYVEQSAPPLSFVVVSGSGGRLSADLTEVEDGIVTDIDGEDFAATLGNVNPVSRIGRPSRLAERDDLIAMGSSTPVVRAWLRGGPTLADDASLAGVARALDDEGVVAAVVAGIEPTVEPTADSGDASGTELVPADPYDAVAIGWSVDDGEAEIHVAYHFGSAEAAERGAGVLERAWRDGTSPLTRSPYSDRVTVDEVDADDGVVTVSLRLGPEGRPSFPVQALQQQEPLFRSR
ncbi:hypothetical protein [Nocardioides humi]|uniref:Uncharacterized protein n=1 Tax=Nocardioides humi TaxID=449461 RepID=A0ABN2A1E2_9ACTN|nr:hypothetical protein [Nocardioides humi]